MTSIAIIDVIGLTYDGNTLNHRGLGGSESAVILMSKELTKLGFQVTVFNNCIDSAAAEGVYDGVTFSDLTKLDSSNDYHFDVVISSRTVIPFLTPAQWPEFADLHPERFQAIKNNAKFRAVWLHDTFCRGDQYLEDMVTRGDIDEIFTLSDFHTSYVTNCDHGRHRMFEVLKRHVFMTRNGVKRYDIEVDIAAKDPFLYVYNASVTKGMIPLVTEIWPRLKQQVPQARLKVIGGYYRFRENSEPDQQEKDWRNLVADPQYAALDVEFTGIIKQSEIAEILAQASYMIFPGAFPETFGISTLESLTYNTPLITTRFGALEETAVEQACYLIDYPIVPNGLFPFVNSADQVERFVATAVRASYDKYLHQQKSYYCNIVKDICTWDTVALQWKQHLYKKLGLYLPVDEYRKVSAINAKVHQVFGRRFTNPEENYIPRNTQQKIVVVSPVYNASTYISRCIESVAAQDYDNYKMIIVDDCSTDSTYDVATAAISKLPTRLQQKFEVIRNDTNHGAVHNQVVTVTNFCGSDDIVMLLDGDDSLVNDNQIFHFYNNLYDGTTEFTYGSCWSMADNIPLVGQPYPEQVKRTKSYRNHKFNWNIPYTHLRTFTARLMTTADFNQFKDASGNWYRAGGDGAVFYTLIESADPNKVKAVSNIVYNYNDLNPLNDYKVNGEEQSTNAAAIVSNKPVKQHMTKKRILIALPTAKNVETKTFKSIYDLIIPDGYETELQFFYGYQIDQIRNLIADWAQRYDYLFSVDSDIAFEKDTLVKLLNADKDVVSGLYIQRKPGQQILEIYRNGYNVPYSQLKGKGLVEIDGCGFGCVLVKSEVFKQVGYPQFVYKSALDHRNTLSEDTYFCMKAKEHGFSIWADTTILCEHIGSGSFVIDQNTQSDFDRLMELSNQRLLPGKHVEYLYKMRADGISPKVVYDIGACVLHWTREAVNVWPGSQYFAFEAMEESKEVFDHFGVPSHLGVLSDQSGKIVEFYQNTTHPGGNTYYKENQEINANTVQYFNESNIRRLITTTLDEVVKQRNFPAPDLIKMDVQGAELDIIKGATETLKSCSDLILELQAVEYNKGAPLRDEVIAYLDTIGFKLVGDGPFMNNGPDGDYHFTRK